MLDECALRAPDAVLPVAGVSVAHGPKVISSVPGLHSDEDQVFDSQNYTESTTQGETSTMKIQASTVTLLTTVWRPSPMPWRRCWITCRIFESVNDMFSNTFSNDLTVQYLEFALRTTFGLTRKSLSEFTGITQAPWLQTQMVLPLESHREYYRYVPVATTT